MIIIAGHLRVAAAKRDDYLASVADVAVRARRAPGCHDFVQSADPIDPERINIYERWDDDDVLLAFRNSGSDEPERPSASAVIGAEVAKYRISTVEDP
ncbi:MAG: antibiotic biosynthesis monooxygenase family protein [Nocardioides sp.]